MMLPAWRPGLGHVFRPQHCGKFSPGLSSIRCYAKKIAPVAAPMLQSSKKRLPVERDPVKLATYCCGSNIRQEGQDVKLGADDEYPEWLWQLHLGKPKQPHELDRNTEEYWETLHKNALYHQNKLYSQKPKDEIRINEKEKLAKLEGIVHRALAYKYFDPGYDIDEWKRRRFRRYGPLGVFPVNHYASPEQQKLREQSGKKLID